MRLFVHQKGPAHARGRAPALQTHTAYALKPRACTSHAHGLRPEATHLHLKRVLQGYLVEQEVERASAQGAHLA